MTMPPVTVYAPRFVPRMWGGTWLAKLRNSTPTATETSSHTSPRTSSKDPTAVSPHNGVLPHGGAPPHNEVPPHSGAPPQNGDPIGEAWMFSDIPTMETRVVAGSIHEGLSPRQLIDREGVALGGILTDSWVRDGFPLLLKLIDAGRRLSGQVHPDDRRAQELEGEPRGKNEAWYVLRAESDARLFLGPRDEVSSRTMIRRIANQIRESEKLFHEEPAVPGRVYPVPAGTIHAIGAGIVLAELQQASDTTYRLTDWGRLGSDGRPRALHLHEAEICADLGLWRRPPDTLPRVQIGHEGSITLLCRFPSFDFEEVRFTRTMKLPLPHNVPSIFMTLTEPVNLGKDSRDETVVPAHHTALVPASWSDVTLSPSTTDQILLLGTPHSSNNRTWRKPLESELKLNLDFLPG